jgi:hypothetical protein
MNIPYLIECVLMTMASPVQVLRAVELLIG